MRVAWQRQMHRVGLHHVKMVEQKPHEVRVRGDAEIQAVEFDDAENQFAEQRRDADNARLLGQRAAEPGHQV